MDGLALMTIYFGLTLCLFGRRIILAVGIMPRRTYQLSFKDDKKLMSLLAGCLGFFFFFFFAPCCKRRLVGGLLLPLLSTFGSGTKPRSSPVLSTLFCDLGAVTVLF